MSVVGTYLFTAFSSVVLAWASHHPQFHDIALWGLGMIGTHFGHVMGKHAGSSGQ